MPTTLESFLRRIRRRIPLHRPYLFCAASAQSRGLGSWTSAPTGGPYPIRWHSQKQRGLVDFALDQPAEVTITVKRKPLSYASYFSPTIIFAPTDFSFRQISLRTAI